MPSKKDAAYYRQYRLNRKNKNAPVPSGPNKKSKFERAEFIAWDGEGFTTDEPIDEQTFQHHFVLLANSVGRSIRSSVRLTTLDCFALLLETARDYPNAIHVVYGGSYDMNHILKDLPQEYIKELARNGDCYWQGFYIKFLPRKSLFIKHKNLSITLWDVIGFFQMPFVRAIKEWLGNDYPELSLIEEGKKTRTRFNDNDFDFMMRYNDAELVALVRLMEEFHKAVSALGLTLARWDGAGAIAAAIFNQQSFRQHLGKQPKPVEMAARHAYFGGRFELGQYGQHKGVSYGFDINSAYPTVFRDMPSLSHGSWRKISNPVPDDITDFSLVHIRWDLPRIRFAPFPYRNLFGLVQFPTAGENWVWGCELLAYLNTIPDYPDWDVELIEAYVFTPNTDEKPFQWVQYYYDERQRIINGESSLPYGCQMVIKLGLNSLYGKTAQSLGWTEEKQRIPPYHNLCYAGYITAKTRAKLWQAAMMAPDDIVMMATDGIISLSELHVDVSDVKQLGKWERKEFDYILSVGSGVYITAKDGKSSFRKRGIETQDDTKAFISSVLRHWGNRVNIYKKMAMRQSRLIGLKTAATSDTMFRRWGSWYEQHFALSMQPGPQTKRSIDERSPNRKPAKGLVRTVPTENVFYTFDKSMSTPYERPWDNELFREGWTWDNPEEIAEAFDDEFS